MSNEYFALEYPADNPKGYCTLDDLEGFEDFEAVRQGASLASNPPDQLSMSMYAEEPRNTVLPDYVQNMKRLVIVSPRLRAFLEAQEVSHVEYYPIQIIDHKGKVASDKYCVAHLVDPVDCIDADASEAKWSNVGFATQRIRRLKKLVLDPVRIPGGRKLFFPRFYRKYPILHHDLAEAMKKEDFTNVDIVPVDECAC
jgi:hypothetical protein